MEAVTSAILFALPSKSQVVYCSSYLESTLKQKEQWRVNRLQLMPHWPKLFICALCLGVRRWKRIFNFTVSRMCRQEKCLRWFLNVCFLMRPLGTVFHRSIIYFTKQRQTHLQIWQSSRVIHNWLTVVNCPPFFLACVFPSICGWRIFVPCLTIYSSLFRGWVICTLHEAVLVVTAIRLRKLNIIGLGFFSGIVYLYKLVMII